MERLSILKNGKIKKITMNFKDKNPLFSKKPGFSSIEALDKCRKKRKIFIF